MNDNVWTYVIVAGLIGGVVGFLVQAIMVAMAKKRRPCDVVPVAPGDGLVEHIDQWAASHGYTKSQAPSGAPQWRRGAGLLTAPRVIELVQDANGLSLQAYVILNALVVKGELALSEPTTMAKPIRKNALKEFNDLLGTLRMPPIAG